MDISGTEHSLDGGVMVKPEGNIHFRRANMVKHLVLGYGVLESLRFIEI